MSCSISLRRTHHIGKVLLRLNLHRQVPNVHALLQADALSLGRVMKKLRLKHLVVAWLSLHIVGTLLLNKIRLQTPGGRIHYLVSEIYTIIATILSRIVLLMLRLVLLCVLVLRLQDALLDVIEILERIAVLQFQVEHTLRFLLLNLFD